MSRLGFFECAVQRRQFGLTPDQRRHVRRSARFEAVRCAAAPDRRHGDWGRKSFYVLIAEIFEFEKIAQQKPRTWRHHNLIRFCQLLQTGRQIRRVTDQRELPVGAFSDQIADDNQAGGDTNPHFNPRDPLKRQFRNEPDDLHGCLDRAFGAVLMRSRKSEVG